MNKQQTQSELEAGVEAAITHIMSHYGLRIATSRKGVSPYEITGSVTPEGKAITYKIISFHDGRLSVIPPHGGYRGVGKLEKTVELVPRALRMFGFEKSTHFQIFGYEKLPWVNDLQK